MAKPPRHRRDWTTGEVQLLRRLREKGNPHAVIGAILGRTNCAVRKQLSRCGCDIGGRDESAG